MLSCIVLKPSLLMRYVYLAVILLLIMCIEKALNTLPNSYTLLLKALRKNS
jgi:hypothetical protein